MIVALRAYYNEIDSYPAQWLKNLITAGHITPGEVDQRSVVDVRPDDLVGFDRCHFFAGIGIWDHALNLAGWGESEVWTGSCPCQPFSAAGGRGGFADERHLWPAFFHLIRERRPAAVLGEQVASKDGLGWLDLVQADLEGENYAVGAADLCAPGERLEGVDVEADEWLQRAILDCPDPVLAGELRDYAEWARGEISLGAPNIRQRLWFVAYADRERREQHARLRQDASGRLSAAYPEAAGRGEAGIMADSADARQFGGQDAGADRGDPSTVQSRGQRIAGVRQSERGGAAGLMGDATNVRCKSVQGHPGIRDTYHGSGATSEQQRTVGAPHFWSDAEWIPCRDGKARPVEPGVEPLVAGADFRVGSGSPYEGRSRAGMLKGYGNAINAQRARAFIEAVMQVRP